MVPVLERVSPGKPASAGDGLSVALNGEGKQGAGRAANPSSSCKKTLAAFWGQMRGAKEKCMNRLWL